MLGLSLLSWWYSAGWKHVATSFSRRLQKTAEAFSIGTLLRTMLAPWRRIVTYPGSSLQAHFQAGLDNMVSRVIGFLVRFFVLLAGFLTLVFIAIISTVELIVWPFLPLLAVASLIKGLWP